MYVKNVFLHALLQKSILLPTTLRLYYEFDYSTFFLSCQHFYTYFLKNFIFLKKDVFICFMCFLRGGWGGFLGSLFHNIIIYARLVLIFLILLCIFGFFPYFFLIWEKVVYRLFAVLGVLFWT